MVPSPHLPEAPVVGFDTAASADSLAELRIAYDQLLQAESAAQHHRESWMGIASRYFQQHPSSGASEVYPSSSDGSRAMPCETPPPDICERDSSFQSSSRSCPSLQGIKEYINNRDEELRRSAVSVRDISPKDEPSKPGRLQHALQQLVVRNEFEALVFVVIFTNVVLAGIDVELKAVTFNHGWSHTFEILQHVYTSIFVVELLIRIGAEGCGFWIQSKNVAWNYFDSFLVTFAVVDTLATIIKASTDFGGMSQFRVVRVIRVTRMLRSLRVVRMIRCVQALRTLVHSIAATLMSVMWSMVLLVLILYGFGIVFAQAVVDHCSSMNTSSTNLVAMACDDPALALFFGTLPRSMFTLLKSITGGLNWHTLVSPLALISPVWVMSFVCFVCFALFAVLNVVTGVFCQGAIESAQQNKELASMKLMANKGAFLKALDEVFSQIDRNNSGLITIDEFEEHLGNDELQAHLQALSIDTSDCWMLFKLLDVDESGSIDRDEFYMGCLQLSGSAKAMDIAKMAYENKVFHDTMEEFLIVLEKQIQELVTRNGGPNSEPSHRNDLPFESPQCNWKSRPSGGPLLRSASRRLRRIGSPSVGCVEPSLHSPLSTSSTN